MQFFCFECKLPSQTWWAVLPDRSILRPAFYRAHPTATRHDVRLRLQHLQEAGCPVPWVLAKELEDQKLPHYSKRDQKLRAVKLQKMLGRRSMRFGCGRPGRALRAPVCSGPVFGGNAFSDLDRSLGQSSARPQHLPRVPLPARTTAADTAGRCALHGVRRLPCLAVPSRASWLDYAGLLRKMTIVEFERFKAAVQRLRAEIMGLDRRRQRITCMKWLMKVQSFAEPSLIFTFLLRLQNEHDKDRRCDENARDGGKKTATQAAPQSAFPPQERRLMEWEPIYRATRRRWVLSPLDAELGFWQMRHRRFVAELGENDFPPSQSCFVQLRERIPTQLKWWRVHRQLQHQALRGAHGSAATPHKLRRLRRLKRRRRRGEQRGRSHEPGVGKVFSLST
eukprot:g6557.t1